MVNQNTSELLLKQAEAILLDDDARHRYDETKMSWIGDTGLDSRPLWVKRTHDNNEYVYSLPVLAAFSVARSSILSIRKDPWHHQHDPRAWFIGEHELMTGRVREPEILSVKSDAVNRFWFQVAGETQATVFAEKGRLPRDQRRYEARLDNNYRATNAEYRSGLRLPVVRYEDIVALESVMRTIGEARGLRLPDTMQHESVDELAPAA